MELLTNSARCMYQECPRKYFYRHEKEYVPIKESEALSFGKSFHKILELHFTNRQDEIPKEIELINNPFKRVIAAELYAGYKNKWGNQVADLVEKEFILPLLNPKTLTPSRTFELAGKIDAIIGTSIVEHKTTSDNISDPACDYWLRLAVDSQISGYFVAAEKLGYKPEKITYDVIYKSKLKPAKATPEKERKYKKDGNLHANQRMTDETPEEFAERLREDITQNPDKYFQRREIARLDSDLAEYMADMWSVAKLIMESRNENYWPKRTSQCFSYGRCAYYEVCAKLASLEDESMYKKEKVNSELTEAF